MSRQQPGVAVANSLVDENPAMLPVRFLEKSVVTERWDRNTWKNPFVDRALDERPCLQPAFGDHGGTTFEIDAIDLVLPLPHSQRSNLEWLRTRVQFAPGSSGRV